MFRALRKVYASFYRDNAFLERLRRGVDEAEVGMAVLAHHSFPDEDELANGVATLRVQDGQARWRLVTQKGAVSVTNPEGGASPEVVDAFFYGKSGLSLKRVKPSSLVALGGHTMAWEADYKALLTLLQKVRGAYAAAHKPAEPWGLDLEYKKMKPGSLVIKQVRRLPMPAAPKGQLLLPTPVQLCTFQGEASDALANHRLKSRWKVAARGGVLEGATLDASLVGTFEVQYARAGKVVTRKGIVDQMPGAKHAHTTSNTTHVISDAWTMDTAGGQATWTLSTSLKPGSVAGGSGVVTLADLSMRFEVKWPQPVPVQTPYDPKPSTRTVEHVRLIECVDEKPLPHGAVKRTTKAKVGAIEAATSLWWPRPPSGPSAGYTAPLLKWDRTVLSAGAGKSVTLKSWFAQTYRPEHHNFSESFIFEPRLDPSLSVETVKALADKGIAAIMLYGQGASWKAWRIDADGKLHKM